MKVAWVVPGFSGDERDWCIPALLDLARVLAQRAELHIFSLRYPHRRAVYPIYGATVHSFGGGLDSDWRALRLWGQALAAIRAEARRGRFAVFHAFWLQDAGTVATLAALLTRTPTILSLGGAEMARLPDIGYGELLHPRQAAIMRFSLRRAAWVTGGSRYILELTRPHLPPAARAKLRLAPLGVDTTRFSPSPHSPFVPSSLPPSLGRGKKGEKQHGPRLLHVGSLLPVKDQATLLRALRRVVDNAPGARLTIVGGGLLEGHLRRLCGELGLESQVTFVGAVPHDRLPDYYRDADLFVLSSRHEAQNMAVLEAAACGLPTVGTAVGVLPDLAPEAAWAVPVGDAAAMAEAIMALWRDPPRRAAMAQAAQARVAAEYSLERAADRFWELYQTTLQRSSSQ
jgi:glycosyltransferase involved in cell wall biosynthesis